MTNTTKLEIIKQWDENEAEREGRNGRIYISRGRWHWLVVVDGATIDSAHDRRKDAAARVQELTK